MAEFWPGETQRAALRIPVRGPPKHRFDRASANRSDWLGPLHGLASRARFTGSLWGGRCAGRARCGRRARQAPAVQFARIHRAWRAPHGRLSSPRNERGTPRDMLFLCGRLAGALRRRQANLASWAAAWRHCAHPRSRESPSYLGRWPLRTPISAPRRDRCGCESPQSGRTAPQG
jgi:hypothetical protein